MSWFDLFEAIRTLLDQHGVTHGHAVIKPPHVAVPVPRTKRLLIIWLTPDGSDLMVDELLDVKTAYDRVGPQTVLAISDPDCFPKLLQVLKTHGVFKL